MSVQLDWQQDLEEEGWPKRQDYGPPTPRGRRLSRYVLIGAIVVLAAGAAVVWLLNQRGQRAIQTDLQEAVDYVHWTLQQDDPNLFVNALDNTSARWIEMGRSEWPRLAAAALEAPPPSVETLSMNGNLARAVVRWTDATTGRSYLARRWYRLDGANWRWTQPRPPGDADLEREQSAHVTLSFRRDDGEFVPAVLPVLDALVAQRCQEFHLADERCHFYLQWEETDADGLPLLWQDIPLPPLASSSGDEMDAPVYLANGRQADWQSTELRRRLQQFYQGRVYVAQSSLTPMRPADAHQLPDSLLGDPNRPLILPTPALEGIDDSGQPHPRWLAFVDRALTDLVLRKVEGYILGSANYVNATWALHQALLATAAGLPVEGQLPGGGWIAPPNGAPLEIPDLSSLGAALQRDPDPQALQQLASLVQVMQEGWQAGELALLPQDMGSAVSLDALLADTLATSSQELNAAWLRQEMERPDSPLSTLIGELVELARQEASIANTDQGRIDRALELYTEEGRNWRLEHPFSNAFFGTVGYGDQWQARVEAIGVIGNAVWVDLIESDGTVQARDLRFFVQDPERGWLRDRPARAFWGNPRQQSSELSTWDYFEIDQQAVEAVLPLFDAAWRQVTTDFGLETTPLSVTVAADVEALVGDGVSSNQLLTPSPRNYVLVDGNDDPAEALRRELFMRMLLTVWQRKLDGLNTEQSGNQVRPPVALFGALYAEYDALNLPTSVWQISTNSAVLQELANGQLPSLPEIVAQPAGPSDPYRESQILLAMYIFQRHGFRWLDPALEQGLAETLNQILQEQGWTMDELEADWRAYLADLAER